MAVLNKFGKIAIGGFVACCCSYFAFQHAVSKALFETDFCKDAVELVKSHNGAKQLLGEPIELISGKFSNFETGPVKSVEISVSGPKSKGKLFITVNTNQGKKPELETVQLEIGANDSKRLEIKSRTASAS